MNDSLSFHLFTLGAGQSGLSFYTTQRDAAGLLWRSLAQYTVKVPFLQYKQKLNTFF
jgi:hypothetical protein